MARLSTFELYQRASDFVRSANFPAYDTPDFLAGYFDRYRAELLRLGISYYDEDTDTEIARVVDHLYKAENISHVPSPTAPFGTVDDGRYRDSLLLIIKRASDPTRTLNIFYEICVDIAVTLTRHMQEFAVSPQPFETFQAQLIDLIKEPHKAILETYIQVFDSRACELGLFAQQRERLLSNQNALRVRYPKLAKAKLVTPELLDAEPKESAYAFLNGTCLLPIFFHTLKFEAQELKIPEETRFSHTHLLGGTGHGKSTLLCYQFLTDVIQDDPPALIVVDGKGTFVQQLQRFKFFEPGTEFSERLVILNPQDALFPPALNMFAQLRRHGSYPEQIRRQIENNTISLFGYIFSAQDFELTEKQATCLSYCVRLLFSMTPTPTIHTLLDLMSDPIMPKTGGVPDSSPFKPFIEAQPPIMRRFMTELFYHPTEYSDTKRQIQNRIYSLLENPAFSAMFSTAERKIDLFDIIQNRKVLLCDCSVGVLGEKAAPLLGRYIISLTLAAAYERIAIPKSEWHPAHLVVDEAQMFVDEARTQPLLQQAREFNLGVCLSHQKLDDLTPKLQATLASNTLIKFAGGTSSSDAAQMAREMNCDAAFIMNQRKTGTHTHFASYVRGYTDKPISIPFELGVLDAEPKMSEAAYAKLIDRNRRLLSSPQQPSAPSIAKEAPMRPTTLHVSREPAPPSPQRTPPVTPATSAQKPAAAPEELDDWSTDWRA